MALHPQCPCSKASLAELNDVLESQLGPVTVHYLRAGKPADASELKRFGVQVSGEVLVYDSDGVLQFHGGITGARGHVGPNAGSREVQRALGRLHHEGIKETPVFGCSLGTTRGSVENPQ